MCVCVVCVCVCVCCVCVCVCVCEGVRKGPHTPAQHHTTSHHDSLGECSPDSFLLNGVLCGPQTSSVTTTTQTTIIITIKHIEVTTPAHNVPEDDGVASNVQSGLHYISGGTSMRGHNGFWLLTYLER